MKPAACVWLMVSETTVYIVMDILAGIGVAVLVVGLVVSAVLVYSSRRGSDS